MEVLDALRRCGGRASRAKLRELEVTRKGLELEVAKGSVLRVRRGLYRLAELDSALDTALAVSGVLSHRSAALHLGLDVRTTPDKPEVIVRRKRHLSAEHRTLVTPHYCDLTTDEIWRGSTNGVRTVLDCARDLPLVEALPVADSALRQGVHLRELRAAARKIRGPGSRKARFVALHASTVSANTFESTLRAIALEAGLDVVPQLQVTGPGLYAKVDLADEGRRLVIEAEGFEFHSQRKAFRRDVRRYTELEVFGWTVLRFTWEDVMIQPEYVRWALESWRRHHDDGTPIPPPPVHLPRLA